MKALRHLDKGKDDISNNQLDDLIEDWKTELSKSFAVPPERINASFGRIWVSRGADWHSTLFLEASW